MAKLSMLFYCRVLKWGGFLGMLLSMLLALWIYVGHNYRYPFDDQFKAWHDGVSYIEPGISGYPYTRDKSLDEFSMELYEKIRSVEDAVRYIKERESPKTDLETLMAAYELTRKRYIHWMYPHHTWLTNPIFRAFETYDPKNSFNEMATADELLRHSANGGCGDTAVTFLEIYRAFGYEGQYVSLDGHHVAEAITENKKWLVDADLEVVAPYSIAEISTNLELIDSIYAKYGEDQRKKLKNIFKKIVHQNGYNGAPRYNDYMYDLHKRWEGLKWFLPLLGVIVGLGLLFLGRTCSKLHERGISKKVHAL